MFSPFVQPPALCLPCPRLAQAAPFHLILWSGTGICQIWDDGVPGKPWPDNYKAVSKPVPTFDAALAVKAKLMTKGVCKI